VQAKYHAFLDESGQRETGTGTDRYYVVAGVIVSASSVDRYKLEMGGLKRAFFRTHLVEIKSNWLRQPRERSRHYLIPYKIDENRLSQFVSVIYDWLLATDLILIAGVVDKVDLEKQYAHPHHPSALAYQMFLQRYQRFLAKRRVKGSVTIDHVEGGTKAGNKWKDLLSRQHRLLLKNGCNYTSTKFLNISDTLSFCDSSHSEGIQLADLVAYNVFRQFKDHGHCWENPTLESLPVYQYFGNMLPRFDHNGDGVFAGFGIAKLPTHRAVKWRIPEEE
jgi:hypothetical protein